MLEDLLATIRAVEECSGLTVYEKEVRLRDAPAATPDTYDTALRLVFSQVVSIQFSYGWSERMPKERRKELRKKYDAHRIDIFSDEENPLGSLGLSPPAVSSSGSFFRFSPSDDRPIHFARRSFSLYELSTRIRPFDLYSEFSCAALFDDDGAERALLLGDHYDDWKSSALTDFATYLRFICSTKFLVQSRAAAYDEPNGHDEEPLSFEALMARVPPIDLRDFEL